MKFSDLYNKVFVKEQNEIGTEEPEVAVPQDFDDVDPAPIISGDETAPGVEGADVDQPPVDATGGQGQANLASYVEELESFALKLNSIDGDSLQRLLANLDKVGTPFDGISQRTKGEIVNAAKSLQSISERIKEFIIHAAKAK
jgi:hypothetical protein